MAGGYILFSETKLGKKLLNGADSFSTGNHSIVISDFDDNVKKELEEYLDEFLYVDKPILMPRGTNIGSGGINTSPVYIPFGIKKTSDTEIPIYSGFGSTELAVGSGYLIISLSVSHSSQGDNHEIAVNYSFGV